MILAAGRGERMRPLTDRVPKPLLEAGGKALIVHLVEALVRARCARLVINTAHLGAQIEAALGDGERWGVRIDYSREASALETAGGIAFARPLLGVAPFLVVNGDIWIDLDYAGFIGRALQAFAEGAAIDAHLLLVDNPPHHPQGDFCLDAAGRIVEGRPAALTFAGVGVYRPRLFDAIVPGTRAPLAPLLFQARARGALSGEHHAGGWFDIGTPARLAALDRQLLAARSASRANYNG
ncbi:MAG: nucleotidyltransferase family protein [Proteobacteria bacterium]|nr:nucleotidyltransferase family protein [Burkholderiales bacterium]